MGEYELKKRLEPLLYLHLLFEKAFVFALTNLSLLTSSTFSIVALFNTAALSNHQSSTYEVWLSKWLGSNKRALLSTRTHTLLYFYRICGRCNDKVSDWKSVHSYCNFQSCRQFDSNHHSHYSRLLSIS